jgi:uncharacterized BrkB/YihY/UPF0761 family membrane protein
MPPTELPAWANQHQALDIRGLTPPQIQARIHEIARRIKSDKTTGLLIAGGLLGALFVLFSKSE